jgi:hypothetical protein
VNGSRLLTSNAKRLVCFGSKCIGIVCGKRFEGFRKSDLKG